MSKKIIIIPLLLVTFVVTAISAYTVYTNTSIAWDGGSGGPGGCCGGGGSAGGPGGGGPNDGGGGGNYNPSPSCTLTINKNKITVGERAKLSWSVTNGVTASINRGIGTVWIYGGDKTIKPTKNTKYTMTVVGVNGQTVTCSDSIKVVEPQPEPPTCDSFTATPSTISRGEQTVLEWKTTNASEVTLTRPGTVQTVSVDGQATASPNNDFTFVITATGAGGTVTCDAPVTVEETAKHPAIKLIKRDASDKDDMQTVVTGGVATFEIVVTNTGDVDLNNVVVTDPVTPSCAKTIGALAVDQSTTYTCTATDVQTDFTNVAYVTGTPVGGGQSVSDDDPTDVTVVAPQTPVCDSFTASPNSFNNGVGGTVTLTWTTTNTDGVNINNGVGSFTASDGNTTVTVNDTTTFILTPINGSTFGQTCPVTVTVNDEPTPDPIECTLTADDRNIDEGDDVTLTWTTDNATEVTIDQGIGDVVFDGSETVNNLRSDTTFILTARNDDDSVTCRVNIEVDEDNGGGGGGGSSSPRCELDISDDRIDRGESVTLEWDSRRATEIEITDDRGNVIVTTDDRLNDDKEELFDGEITIKPTEDTTYTMIAERGSRDDECEVDVEVRDGGAVTVTETRRQLPTVAGISLTQVPYTGFEAGPLLTFIFYALLAVWGLFVAYVIAVRKGAIDGVSFAGAHDHVPYTEASTDNHTVSDYVANETPTIATPGTTTANAPSNLPTGAAPVVGYAAASVAADATVADESVDTSLTALENLAHEHKALFSSDAMRHFTQVVPEGKQGEELTQVIADAKASFPNEDGWVVINLARLESLMETQADEVAADATPTPTTAGSLAEAIVTGDIVAAYQMIAHRPMIALADAAAELDTVLRVRAGASEIISEMLEAETKHLSDEQLRTAVHALTSAIDGTYTSEEDAVKMAIMKAVKAIS